MTQIILSIPNNEVSFFKKLATKMGWTFEKKEDILNKFISSCPTDSQISDEEIQNEIDALRRIK